MDSTIVLIALGASVAGFVQGLSGFAFGLVAMSFWAWVVDPKLAAVMAVFGALTGQILATFTVKRSLGWSQLYPFLVGGILGIPVGLTILPLLNIHLFKACLGLLLIVWCPIMLVADRLPTVSVNNRFVDGVVGILGGIMGGIGGFTGTIPTLWCTLRRLDKDQQRMIIQNFNLFTLSFTMISYLAAGVVTYNMLPMFGIILPAMLIPTILGNRLYIGISPKVFRQIVLSLLTASGLALLSSSLPKLVGA